MTSIITILKTIIAILPILRDLITAAEAFFPAQGSGFQKLEMVKTMIQSAYNVAVKAETPFSTVWPVLEKLIGFVVPHVTEKPTVTAAVLTSSQVDTTATQVASLAPKTLATVAHNSGTFPATGVQLASDA
jgi:hypothetical protein